ncbi:hypothetical protein [Chitinophaga rhizophila]|uniref:Uncharacterized protein n=1 Tax=Chitinophaga rhizophila TaxID=2866212 RepID=A0ABS7G7Q5_9BACT|nr:hypothetical protein [Chitinophaga rhizophila]MBW8682757.1 hypothetical protein [Chitinophaga rhizophila]
MQTPEGNEPLKNDKDPLNANLAEDQGDIQNEDVVNDEDLDEDLEDDEEDDLDDTPELDEDDLDDNNLSDEDADKVQWEPPKNS